MKILISYATYAGSTEATAEYIKRLLEQQNHDVTLQNISETTPEQVKGSDLSLFGSPSWLQNGEQGQPHTYFFDFFETYTDESFQDQRISLFGLGDQTYTYYCGAVDVIGNFFSERKAHIIGEPLRIENFYIDNNGKEEQVKEWVTATMKSLSDT
jgi:flavodoxin